MYIYIHNKPDYLVKRSSIHVILVIAEHIFNEAIAVSNSTFSLQNENSAQYRNKIIILVFRKAHTEHTAILLIILIFAIYKLSGLYTRYIMVHALEI